MHVESGRPPMRAVYQRGRGHDPVTVVGSTRSLVAVNTCRSYARAQTRACTSKLGYGRAVSGAVPSDFRRRLAAGETLVGSFVNLGSALVAEVMGLAGFDWLVLDLEHGAGNEQTVLAQMQALSNTGVAPL